MFQVTDLTLSNSGLVEFSISTVTCSRAGAKETETARRCTLALGGWKREGNVTELQDSTSKEGNMVDTEGCERRAERQQEGAYMALPARQLILRRSRRAATKKFAPPVQRQR